jgi:Tfp pilus assembly protein PilN
VINLLPPELKQDYRYARYNRRLARWSLSFLLAIVGVAVITVTGLFIMHDSIGTYQTKVANMKASLARQDISGTEKQVTDISNNLKLMVNVLSKEILFSKLLEQLGSITPSNVILTNLSISQTQSAIDITAQTVNYSGATQLQVNLASPNNQIFSKADLVNITCASGATATNPKYPCTAILRAQFTKNNPFLFINSKAQAAG